MKRNCHQLNQNINRQNKQINKPQSRGAARELCRKPLALPSKTIQNKNTLLSINPPASE